MARPGASRDSRMDREIYIREYRTTALIVVLIAYASLAGVLVGAALVMWALEVDQMQLWSVRAIWEFADLAWVAVSVPVIGYLSYRHLRAVHLAKKPPPGV